MKHDATNDVIYETVVTTVSREGVPHVAPMGVRYQRGGVVLMPFKPSTTLDNIDATGHAVLNIVSDTRVFAGCVTGRKTSIERLTTRNSSTNPEPRWPG